MRSTSWEALEHSSTPSLDTEETCVELQLGDRTVVPAPLDNERLEGLAP